MKKTALAGLLLCVSQGANAVIMSLDFTGEITNTTNLATGQSWNYGLWDQWTDIGIADIYVGAALTGSIWIDTDFAPPDNDASVQRLSVRTDAPVIDSASRWLSLSLGLNGNDINPATMARPAGIRTPNSDPVYSSDANQWLTLTEGSSFQPSSMELFSDWDTEFDGILHDRQLRLQFAGHVLV